MANKKTTYEKMMEEASDFEGPSEVFNKSEAEDNDTVTQPQKREKVKPNIDRAIPTVGTLPVQQNAGNQSGTLTVWNVRTNRTITLNAKLALHMVRNSPKEFKML